MSDKIMKKAMENWKKEEPERFGGNTMEKETIEKLPDEAKEVLGEINKGFFEEVGGILSKKGDGSICNTTVVFPPENNFEATLIEKEYISKAEVREAIEKFKKNMNVHPDSYLPFDDLEQELNLEKK